MKVPSHTTWLAQACTSSVSVEAAMSWVFRSRNSSMRSLNAMISVGQTCAISVHSKGSLLMKGNVMIEIKLNDSSHQREVCTNSTPHITSVFGHEIPQAGTGTPNIARCHRSKATQLQA